MLEQTIDKPNNVNRLLLVSLVLALALANSSLLYFVLWDMLSPSNTFWVILFTISGAAHVIYLFLPWLLHTHLRIIDLKTLIVVSQFLNFSVELPIRLVQSILAILPRRRAKRNWRRSW